ncbi:MAG: efflux RND transporter periplasmic adaptor subunit [Pirellulaceae bacterium]
MGGAGEVTTQLLDRSPIDGARLAANWARRHNVDFVAILLTAGGAAPRLAGLHGAKQFDRRTVAAALLKDAARECLHLRQSTLWQRGDRGEPAGSPTAQLGGLLELDSVAVHALPAIVDEPSPSADTNGETATTQRPDHAAQVVGVVVMGMRQQSSRQDLAGARRRLREITAAERVALGSAAVLVQVSRQGVWGALSQLVRGGSGYRRLSLVAIVTVITLLVLMIPLEFRPSCAVTLEPAHRRIVNAPFDSAVRTVHVKPGDAVTAGQVLAELDQRELGLQIATSEAQLAQAIRKRAAAMANRDATNLRLEQLEVERLEAEVTLLTERRQQLELRSPLDGWVISGDVEQLEGEAVRRGQPLFEVGRTDDLIARVEIPEEYIQLVRVGALVHIELNDAVGTRIEAEVVRIHPRAEARQGRSVFVVDVASAQGALRAHPGMQGTAYVATVNRSIGWVLLHRPLYKLRQLTGW